jgi:hypothetical protein
MIIALLFNWRAYEQSGNYWHETRKEVFGTQIIQNSGQHMKLSIGDVLVGLKEGTRSSSAVHGGFWK